MLERVTAGDALFRVIRTLTERRPLDDILGEVLIQTRAMLDAAETYILIKTDDGLTVRASDGLVMGPNGRRTLRDGDRAAVSFVVSEGRITRIDAVRNPEKLRRL